jgi:hypothetical protein
MSDERWIVIPNWDKFQHYKDRDPPWIKNYTHLLHDADYLSLTLTARGLLHGIWLCIAAARLQVTQSQCKSIVGPTSRHSHWEELVNAGFIELSASKPLAHRYQSARPEEETEREKERTTPISPQVGTVDNFNKPSNRRADGTNPRATGTNQRAVSKSDKEQRHADLLEAARELADTWEIPDSSIFDHELDVLETNHGSSLSFGERDDLWDKAFKLAR